MWAALNLSVGGLEICSLNSTGTTTATTLIWKERGGVGGGHKKTGGERKGDGFDH